MGDERSNRVIGNALYWIKLKYINIEFMFQVVPQRLKRVMSKMLTVIALSSKLFVNDEPIRWRLVYCKLCHATRSFQLLLASLMSAYTTLAHLFVTLVVRCFSGAMWHLLGRFLDLLTAIRMQVAVAVSMCAVPPHSPACWSLRCTRHALYARLRGSTAPAAGTGTASHHIEHTTCLLDSTVLTQTTFYQLSQKT